MDEWAGAVGDFEAGNHFLVLGSKSRALGRQLGHECPMTQGQTPGSQESRDCRKKDGSHGEAGDFPDQASHTRIFSQMQPQITLSEISPIRESLEWQTSC